MKTLCVALVLLMVAVSAHPQPVLETPEHYFLEARASMISLEFSPDGTDLAVAIRNTPYREPRLIVRDSQTGHVLHKLIYEHIDAVGLLPSGRMSVLGAYEENGESSYGIGVRDPQTWGRVRLDTLKSNDNDYSEIGSVAYNEDETLAVTVPKNGESILLWDVPSGEPFIQFPLRDTSRDSVVGISASGRVVLLGNYDGGHLWRAGDGPFVRRSQFTESHVYSISCMPGDHRALVGCNGGRVYDIDMDQGVVTEEFSLGSGGVYGFSPDGNLAVTIGGESGTIWDVGSKQRLVTLTDCPHPANGAETVAFSPDRQRIAIGSTENDKFKLTVWDLSPYLPTAVEEFGTHR